MASKLYNRARVTISSTGTGTLSLSTAVSGYQTFSSAGAQNGDVVSYVIEDGLSWEVGTGTFNSSANTLSRTVTQSYNGSTYGTSPISITTAAQVFISPLAADLQAGTSAGNLVQLDGSAKLPAVDGSNLTNVKTPPGGTTGQVQYNAGSNTFGGFTVSGDGTLDTSTGALTVTKTNGVSFGALATTTPGTGVATALAINVGTAGSVVVNGGALGTPTSGTLTNCTGLPIVAGTTGTLTAARGGTGLTALGTGVATALGNTTNAASGLATLDANQNISIAGTLAMGSSFLRNRIINGGMDVWQRGTSGFTSNGNFSADRFTVTATTLTAVSQSTDVPSGYKYSISINGNPFATLSQKIEGINCVDLVGQSVTISFWVKQSVGAGSSSLYVYLGYGNSLDTFTSPVQIGSNVLFTGSSTWTRYSATFTSLPSGAANGLLLNIGANVNGASTILITGIQLEPGSIATPFERRSYGQELALCQRYYERADFNLYGSDVSSTGISRVNWFFKVSKRASPSVSLGAGSDAIFDQTGIGGAVFYKSAAFAFVASTTTASAEL